MIDIPWAYEPDEIQRNAGCCRTRRCRSSRHVRSTSTSIMHADAVLFMWVTNFILARGLHLETADGMGRFRAEDRHHMAERPAHFQSALAARPDRTHGDGRARQAGHQADHQTTLLHGPFHLVRKGEHSAKPVEAYDSLSGFVPRRVTPIVLALPHNDRWDCHGDQAPTLTVKKEDAA